MVQSKIQLSYGSSRTLYNQAIIRLAITSWTVTKEGTIYEIDNLAVQQDGSTILDEHVTKFVPNEKLLQIDAYLQANYSYQGLNKVERDWIKAKHGLLLFVQTDLFPNGKTIYQSEPQYWELTP
jgi:hypothetical protein